MGLSPFYSEKKTLMSEQNTGKLNTGILIIVFNSLWIKMFDNIALQ